MQSNQIAYKNTLMAFLHILNKERIFGLFKGIVPLILNQFPNNAL